MCPNKLCLVYQYLLFKGDYYHDKAKRATEKLKNSKCLSSEDYVSIMNDLQAFELFDIISTELYNLLK